MDFRKSINGLAIIVENDMALSALSGALFIFCNKKRDKPKLHVLGQNRFCPVV
ncbi:MAG: IS66 family insertion sequence element accessory protein TnpB [Gammaproteobacteria bacterium]|nr:IS66 family insertion sequence element accessory protein TnpB [Gammaproteobacteria bacterium]